ncbi:MAG: PilZ domain-containing protein [Xanthobacteraceae bacterium]|nr:PilZ domain-containing protein [Xanthobacteraceae bacterium]QYK43865.1 MAG: PilZ domain-containing protein [Xanthobacteraceae bacterium]
MLEQRQVLRHRTFLQGRVLYNGGRSSIDCIIRELTEEGARLVFSGSAPLPHTFELNIPNRDQTIRVEIVWNHGNEVGVKFAPNAEAPNIVPALAPAASPGTHGTAMERIEKLERELASLRRRIADLEAKNG